MFLRFCRQRPCKCSPETSAFLVSEQIFICSTEKTELDPPPPMIALRVRQESLADSNKRKRRFKRRIAPEGGLIKTLSTRVAAFTEARANDEESNVFEEIVREKVGLCPGEMVEKPLIFACFPAAEAAGQVVQDRRQRVPLLCVLRGGRRGVHGLRGATLRLPTHCEASSERHLAARWRAVRAGGLEGGG
eukprot:scaffold1323_cov255-Pinguiococcus_pyrenoidosus.AAC.3